MCYYVSKNYKSKFAYFTLSVFSGRRVIGTNGLRLKKVGDFEAQTLF
jgi:hypothetical protein